jgi:2'-5' RNA ligase superfamily
MTRFQSILMPVAEAEPLVEPFRRAGDWSSAYGIPAHMTIAGPWPLSVPLPLPALGRLGVAIRGTRYTLGTVDTLGDAICLFPEDDSALMHWRAAILDTVNTVDELDEEWRIHLTVCRGSAGSGADTIKAALGKALPLRCEVAGLLLARMLGDAEVTVQPL